MHGQWACQHADRFDIPQDRLALGGASAGGNLAAGTVVRILHGDMAKVGKPEAPSVLVLAYATLLAVQPSPGPALRAALDGHPDADQFGPAVVRQMYENYLGTDVSAAPTAASPANADPGGLANWPSTFILNSEVDELRVSSEFFARKLKKAGVPVELVIEPGTQHGHLNVPSQPAATRSLNRMGLLHGWVTSDLWC